MWGLEGCFLALGQVEFGFVLAFDFDNHVGIWRHMPDPPYYVALVVKDSVFKDHDQSS